jgi:branched-chain amino acid aminotransferase
VDQNWLFASSKHPNPTPAEDIAAAIKNPGFGLIFSDHMVTVEWTEAQGWHDAKIAERKPFQMDPGLGGAALRAGNLRGSEGL